MQAMVQIDLYYNKFLYLLQIQIFKGKSKISGTIPATAYFFNFLILFFIFSFIRFGIKSPNLGLILMNTFPYCGGTNSSPPNTK